MVSPSLAYSTAQDEDDSFTVTEAGGMGAAADGVMAIEELGLETEQAANGNRADTSGLAANPVRGRVADRVVDLGGAVVLGEIAEIMGAEHLLAARATNPDTSARLLRVINRVEREAAALGLDIRGTQPSPGNIRGGLTTIEEKSLGATHKAGERTPLEDVIAYAAPGCRGVPHQGSGSCRA